MRTCLLPLFLPPLLLFSRPTPNFILVQPSTICSAKHVNVVAFPYCRAIHRAIKVRSSRPCVGRFPLGLDDLTLWHDEWPDNRETLLLSHVSLKTSASSIWPPLNLSQKKKSFPKWQSPERRQARSVTSRTGWFLRIGFWHPCLKI